MMKCKCWFLKTDVKELQNEKLDFLHSKNWIHLLIYVTQSCPMSLGVYWDISYLASENIFPLFIREKKLPFHFHYPKKCIKNVIIQFKNSPSLISFSFPSSPSSHILYPSPFPFAPHCTQLTQYTNTLSHKVRFLLLALVSDICFGSRVYFEFLLLKRKNAGRKSCFETVALRRACQSKFNWEMES